MPARLEVCGGFLTATTSIQESISEAPLAAVLLAWLNQDSNLRPVLGYLRSGRGYVVFVGQPLISLDPNRSLFGSLINSLAHYSAEELKQLPMATPVVAESASKESLPSSPVLIEPLSGATLPQPDAGESRFDWEDIPTATSYEIVVIGPSAVFPVVQAKTNTSDYVVPVRRGYVAENNLAGWSWRVRSHYRNGVWGPWSKVRRFNVNPRLLN